MHDARRIFDAHADDYDALRRRLVPGFDAFYAGAVAALSLAGRPVRRVLDLGAGTGLLSERVATAHPDAELVLLDASPAMLEHARARLGSSAAMHVGDLRDALPDGPFDAVVSSLAIHHVDDAEKRLLYARTADVLDPGGVFVNADQVLGTSARFTDANLAWHAATSAALGSGADEWAAAMERMSIDLPATVEDQLAWLRDAGFADADCVLKDHGFAVLVGLV